MRPEESFLDIIHQHLNSDETVLSVFDHHSIQLIQEKIAHEEPDLDAIEKQIGRDPSLTGQVLKAANSAFFKGLNKVSTIRNAIIRLGTGEISNIARLLMKHDVSCNDSFCNRTIEKLWRHSMGCAIGSKWLAKQCGFESLMPEAFTAGLLHDVGKLLLITVVENLYRSEKNELRPSDLLLNEVMETFHAEHGYLLLKNWNLPEQYCKVAREHHFEEVNPNDTLLIMVRLVNKVCNKLGIGLHEDPSIILAATPEANHLGVSEVFLAKLEITLEDSLLSPNAADQHI